MERSPIRTWLEEHQNEFVNDMMEFFRIRSVSEPSTGNYPFGEGCAKMLDTALEMSRKYGLDTENHEYYCGSALLRGETERELGVFSHIDVVDEGEGWQSPPYEPVIKEGWIYARGSSDNKGPAVASLYALRYLKEHKIPLKHTIRLYYGCSEERGMEDIEYYVDNCSLPDFSFVPDASFAVCYAEKGILEGEFSRKLEGNVIAFHAGHATNAVAAAARAVVTGVTMEDVRGALSEGDEITIKEVNDGIEVSAEGKTAHAAFPEDSENAAVKLAAWLCRSSFTDANSKECLRFLAEAFAGYYGAGMGIDYEDDLSGKLTMIGGTTRTGAGEVIQSMNIRYPASIDQEWLIQTVSETGKRYGWMTKSLKNNVSHSVDPDDPKIHVMNEICNRIWGREFKPYAMGGGTYARKLPNAVAYGPGILDQKKPGWPDHGKGHQPDECVCIENMMKAAEIYIEALIALDGLVPLA